MGEKNRSLAERAIEDTRNWFQRQGREVAVIGISGGKDSAVAAALCVKALGREKVIGVLMPDGHQADLEDARQVVEELEIPYVVVNIEGITNSHRESLSRGENHGVTLTPTPQARYNLPPRVRMTLLYEVAQSQEKPAVVVGTGNAAEAFVGYTTKWGDNACDFAPLKHLWVHEVLTLGEELGYFPNIIHKTPADGLTGRSDEENLGFSYEQVYQVAGGNQPVPAHIREEILQRHQRALHKDRVETLPL